MKTLAPNSQLSASFAALRLQGAVWAGFMIGLMVSPHIGFTDRMQEVRG